MTPIYPPLIPGKKYAWQVTVDCSFELGKRTVMIPKGYEFDGHTVPRFLWWLFSPNKRDIYAALAHDILYEFNKTIGVTRKEADDVYKKLINDPNYKVSSVRSWLFPQVVKLFGWAYFYWNAK